MKDSYRLGIGIIMLNNNGKVFVGKRIDSFTEQAWQMPQGGIDSGEDVKAAALRELGEEVGTQNIKVIGESQDWYYYDIPDEITIGLWSGKWKWKGQKQKWFAMHFLGDDSEINISTDNPEFKEWKWVELEDLPELIVFFKKKLYEDLLKEFKPIISKYFDEIKRV